MFLDAAMFENVCFPFGIFLHQLVLIASLPFVHTASRSYRLSDQVNNSDCNSVRFLNVAVESLVNLIT